MKNEKPAIHSNINSITVGSFDGLHLAHQKLISQVDMVVVIERNSGYLTAGYKRSLYTDKPITIYQFKKIKALSPVEFVAKLREDFPALKKIVVGYDFCFGKEKKGNAKSLGELFDGKVVIVDEVMTKSIPVHSKTIKMLLRKGDIKTANALLGRNYRIDGEVIAGQGLGQKLLVPTLNLKVEHYQLPLDGVYTTKTNIDGKWLPSVSFIGHRVSTDGSFAVETHILDREIGQVAGTIWIEFIDFIRSNMRFDTLAILKKQITDDINQAKRSLHER